MPLPPIDGEPDPDGADCVACGRCCHHGPHTVHLLVEDEARMGEDRLRRLTVLMDRPPYMRFMQNDGERCAGLDLSVEGQFPCRIYEVRPSDCRIVEPGSPCCLEARRLGHLGSSQEFVR
jgi:Fe-S-cluster containining protein